MQGRANAALLVMAREMGADFIEPADKNTFASVLGRTHGCTFELRVVESPTDKTKPTLTLGVRHFHTQTSQTLSGPGMQPPDLDPVALRRTVEQACYEFATEH